MGSHDISDMPRPGLRHTPAERMAFRGIAYATPVALLLWVLLWWLGCR